MDLKFYEKFPCCFKNALKSGEVSFTEEPQIIYETFEAYRGIHEYNTLNEAIEDAMDKHIDYALKNRNLKEEEKDTLRIYKYDRIPNNLPINEYLDHVTHNR